MKPSEKLLNSISPKLAKIELARRHFADFVSYTKPDYQFNWHHILLCDKLDQFAKGKINKLMVFMPPQHGKSQLTTRHYPSYMLGLKPATKISVCSYSATLAQAFNRDIQRIIDDLPYHDIFPETLLNSSNVTTDAHGAYLRNSDIFETLKFRGFVKTVGVGGSLTGTPIDIGIIDDPFKDREEAMSIRIRDKVYSWYTDVFKTRLHNTSQELIIMTRWHEDDLAGRILKTENDWEVITFQAIKERDIPGDPRAIGEALWPDKHSLERILAIKETSPFTFSSLYQQEPKPSTDALVFPEWSEYDQEPDIAPIYGLDFGFSNDPSAIIQVKIHKQDMYLREMLYKKGLTTPDLDQNMRFVMPQWARIAADSADPRTIEDLRRKGWNIVPSVKGPDSVINGINWIKGFKLHVHKDSHNLKNELFNYQWLMYGGKPTNSPIDSYNHLIDSARYTKTLYKVNTGLKYSFHKS
jgi:hypothetical protein